MTSDTQLAFAHPEERAKATLWERPLDRISLRDHIVTVEIGAFQVERDVTQRLSFNIVVEVRHAAQDLGDDVDLILSYDRVTEAIDIELAAERLNLLETLAERIAERILAEPQAERIFIRIEKLDRGGGALGVEIARAVTDVTDVAEPLAPVGGVFTAPRVVFLSNEALRSAHLIGWIDQLGAMKEPLLICVAPMEGICASDVAPQTRHRIDLLAIEQNAWRLAGSDPRCVVVQTRTELDWALKNNQISVWAPAKFVMDAVDSPVSLVRDPLALAQWFAAQVGACEMLVIGANAPETAQVATRVISAAQESI